MRISIGDEVEYEVPYTSNGYETILIGDAIVEWISGDGDYVIIYPTNEEHEFIFEESIFRECIVWNMQFYDDVYLKLLEV